MRSPARNLAVVLPFERATAQIVAMDCLHQPGFIWARAEQGDAPTLIQTLQSITDLNQMAPILAAPRAIWALTWHDQGPAIVDLVHRIAAHRPEHMRPILEEEWGMYILVRRGYGAQVQAWADACPGAVLAPRALEALQMVQAGHLPTFPLDQPGPKP